MSDLLNNPSTPLGARKCKPCLPAQAGEAGTPPMSPEEIKDGLLQLHDWEFLESQQITKEFVFKDFAEAIEFVNKVAVLAESEGHHPDIEIHYKKVVLTLWTHSIHGLSENDFILAAKIDKLHGE